MNHKTEKAYSGWMEIGGESYAFDYLIEVIRELCGDVEDPAILDFGCEQGRHAVFLKRNGFRVFGTDINKISHEQAQSYFKANGFNPDDIKLIDAKTDGCRVESEYQIPFDDDTFDFIYSMSVFEHIENPDIVLKELHRITKSGGVIYLYFPGKWNLFEAHLKMPLVHFLPPSRFREIYISIYNFLGVGWYKGGKRQSEWLEKNVFYRSDRETDRLLGKYFRIQRIPLREFNERFFHKKPGRIRNPFLSKITNRILSPFTGRHMVLIKGASNFR